jgi:nickel-dependent lactate racemase
MEHPSVVTINHRSAPRILFSGDMLVEVDLPVGARVIYPKPPVEPLKDVEAAIKYAINHPYNSEPLYAKLKPGMKVCIAIDDISLPLPPMKLPDIRQTVLTIVLELLSSYGVDDVQLIVANCLHRRMTAWEVKRMVGEKIFNAYWPDKLYNHDAEDADNMKHVGTTEEGHEIILNRVAVESDLVIYVNLNLVPMDGGHKSVGVGLCGYKTLLAHHNPYVMRKSMSYMDPDPTKSALHDRVNDIGRIVNKKLNIFHIETTVNNRMFDRQLEFLGQNEDDFSKADKFKARALVETLKRLPQKAREEIFYRVPSPFGVTGVFAGETEATHAQTIRKTFEQYLVPVNGQCDIVVSGIPYISPYNVYSFMNPLLVQVMAQGYLFNLYRGHPMLKKGGTMIIFHPLTDRFDNDQHAPYIEFFHKLLPQTRDAVELHKRFEKSFSQNPAYVEMYRRGRAFHPAHAFYMWYWGEAGRQHIGRLIVVGADNEYIPKILGWETAPSFQVALRMAKETAPPNPNITMVHLPPIVMADVTL